MHEMAIVDSMLRVAESEAKTHELHIVEKVKIVIGELSGVVPEILQTCWQMAADNTILASAVLELEKKPAVALCRQCGAHFNFKDNFLCPHCSGGVERIISGKELYIDFIEGE